MPRRPVPLPVVSLVCLLLLGTAFLMALSSIALAGDGAYYLIRIIGTEQVFGPELRFLGNAIRQWPLLLAVRLGMTDTHVLSAVFGIGLLVVPASAWAAAVALARPGLQAFSAVALTAGLCAGTTWFFAIGENVVFVPLTVLVAVLLWQPREWSWGLAALAALAAAILVATYETTLVTAPVFVLWAARRARASTSSPGRYGAWVVALASALSILAAIAGILVGEERTPAHVRGLLLAVVSGEPWPFYLALVATFALTAAMTPRIGPTVRAVFLGFGVLLAAVATSGLIPTVPAAFAARGGAAIAAFVLQLFLFWDWTRDGRESASTRHPDRSAAGGEPRWLVLVSVLFVAAMAYADVRGLSRWSRSLDTFQSEVERTAGVTWVDDVVPAGRREVVWGWTSSSLSLIVRQESDAGILVDRYPTFVPFPPISARDQLADEYSWRE